MFEKYGKIRSCKTVRKELLQSYLGVKRSVKVFGFVCFFESEHARDAKKDLNEREINNKLKLFVDYHQSKREREEILKLKMLNQSQKIMQRQMMINSPSNLQDMPFPGMIRNLGIVQGNFFGQQMLRKFPQNAGFPRPQVPNMGFNNNNFVNPNLNNMNNNNNNNNRNTIDIGMMDKTTKTEFFGEKLFNKISTNQSFIKFSV